MRACALLLLLVLCCALVSGNLVGLSYTDYAANAIVSISPANASVVSQSLPFNSQWLYATSSAIDLAGGTYYLFTMNATGAFAYAVPLGLSSYSTPATRGGATPLSLSSRERNRVRRPPTRPLPHRLPL